MLISCVKIKRLQLNIHKLQNIRFSKGKSLAVTLLVSLLMLANINLSAQNYFKDDSLHSIYNSTDDISIKVDALIKLSRLYELTDLSKCLDYGTQAVEEASKVQDYNIKVQAYSNLASVFTNQGSYVNATEMYLEAKSLIEENNDTRKLVTIVFNLGVVRYLLEDNKGALEEFNHALDLHNTLMADGDSTYETKIQNFYVNVGSVYKKLGNFEAAIEYMQKAIEASEKNNDQVQLAKGYNNIGEIYLELNDFSRAKKNIEIGIDYRKANYDQIGLARSYLNLVDYYIDMDQLDSAMIINKEAIKLGESVNSLDVLRGAYYLESLIYENLNDYKSSNEALKNFYQIRDSIQSESVVEKSTRLQLEYEYNKIEELRKQKHAQFIIKLYSAIALLVLLLVIFILLFYLYRTRARQVQDETLNLKRDLEMKNKELTTNVMYLLKKNELINNISNRLLRLKTKMKDENKDAIQRIIFDLQAGSDKEVWEEFELRFQQVHNDFYTSLQRVAPDLTPSELKICAFLKLNMNSKEISALIHQSIKSVEVKRTKIRKKLGITNTDINLITYLNEL